jgi:hypothetical protein
MSKGNVNRHLDILRGIDRAAEEKVLEKSLEEGSASAAVLCLVASIAKVAKEEDADEDVADNFAVAFFGGIQVHVGHCCSECCSVTKSVLVKRCKYTAALKMKLSQCND